MTSHVSDPEAASRGTLALLETRLKRLEFLLHGTTNGDGALAASSRPSQGNETLWARLDALEAALAQFQKLTGPAGGAVRDIERLCRQTFGHTESIFWFR